MNVKETADCIWEGYRHSEYFPPELVGRLSFDEALRVQLEILARRIAEGERLAGWKIGLTSAAVRAHFGTERQPFGHILESGVIRSPVFDLALDHTGNSKGCWSSQPDVWRDDGLGTARSDASPTTTARCRRYQGIASGMEIDQKRFRYDASTARVVCRLSNLTQWAIVDPGPSPPATRRPSKSDSLHVAMSSRRMRGRQALTSLVSGGRPTTNGRLGRDFSGQPSAERSGSVIPLGNVAAAHQRLVQQVH